MVALIPSPAWQPGPRPRHPTQRDRRSGGFHRLTQGQLHHRGDARRRRRPNRPLAASPAEGLSVLHRRMTRRQRRLAAMTRFSCGGGEGQGRLQETRTPSRNKTDQLMPAPSSQRGGRLNTRDRTGLAAAGLPGPARMYDPARFDLATANTTAAST